VSAAPSLRPEQPAPDEALRDLRERVSEIDRAILAAVNMRLELVSEIVRHKQETGRPLYDAGREEAMLGELLRANRGRLTDDGVAELQASLLYLTKRQLGIAASVGR
jgi:chorismate mutase